MRKKFEGLKLYAKSGRAGFALGPKHPQPGRGIETYIDFSATPHSCLLHQTGRLKDLLGQRLLLMHHTLRRGRGYHCFGTQPLSMTCNGSIYTSNMYRAAGLKRCSVSARK